MTYTRDRASCPHENTPTPAGQGAPSDLDAVCPDCGATVGVHQVDSIDSLLTRAFWADARGDDDLADRLVQEAVDRMVS